MTASAVIVAISASIFTAFRTCFAFPVSSCPTFQLTPATAGQRIKGYNNHNSFGFSPNAWRSNLRNTNKKPRGGTRSFLFGRKGNNNNKEEKDQPPQSSSPPLPSSSANENNNNNNSNNNSSPTIEFQLHPSITNIPAESWDSFLQCPEEDDNKDIMAASPFLEHAWLRCLEESRCASPETGWAPQHVSVKMENETVAYVPMYIKGHSMGEFIFDQQWAEAAHRTGIEYYPKLLVGVPFTPATGQRILIHPEKLRQWSPQQLHHFRRVLGRFLRQIASSNQLSSVHLNFCTDEEASCLTHELQTGMQDGGDGEAGSKTRNTKNGTPSPTSLAQQVKTFLHRQTQTVPNDYLRRTSLQYHWQNANPKNNFQPYTSFEDYLQCFKSKRRITIRRERQKVTVEQNIRIDAIVGADILKYDGLVERMYDLYRSTVDKMYWGNAYLTLEFFDMVCRSDFVKNLCFLCARERRAGEDDDSFRASDVFAGTFNIVKNGVFYGRYWGCLKQVKNLHFETCYWAAIEYCIKAGLRKMEPGAGGGDYKWARGFDSALIHSCHYVCDPRLRRAVAQFVEYERENNVASADYLSARSVIGSGGGRTKRRKQSGSVT